MHRIGKLTITWLIPVLMPVLLQVSFAAAAELTATVDRTRVTELDLVTLTIRLSHGTATGSPDFGVLEQDFEIVGVSGPNRSSQIIIENGRQFTDSRVEWALHLRPKRTGSLSIPTFTIAGERTDPITIDVQQASAQTVNRMNQFVFFETSVDTTSTYVQGQVIYTVKLFYVDAISGDFPPPPAISDAVIETVENERRYESIVDNRRFYVLEKRYAIYPQLSGKLTIPRETFTGTRGRGGFFSERERVSAVSKQHVVEVKPRPAAFTSDHWLPAKAVTVTESWSQIGADSSDDPTPQFTVGEPVNRTLTITAHGLSSSLLPPFAALEPDNAKTYQDPAETQDRATPDGIISSLESTVGIVPTAPGTLTLPEIRVPWWNTTTDSLEVATIPAQTYKVAPAPGGTATFVPPERPMVTDPAQQPQPPATSTSESRMWQLIAAILAGLWFITMYQWWVLRRRLGQTLNQRDSNVQQDGPATTATDEKSACDNLARACAANDPVQVRATLFLWGKALEPRTRSLADLTALIGDEHFTREVDELEVVLYAPQGAGGQASAEHWQGDRLLALVAAARNASNKSTGDQATTDLLQALNPA